MFRIHSPSEGPVMLTGPKTTTKNMLILGWTFRKKVSKVATHTYPNCLQTTKASSLPKSVSQTVPHLPLKLTSRRPLASSVEFTFTSRTSTSMKFKEKLDMKTSHYSSSGIQDTVDLLWYNVMIGLRYGNIFRVNWSFIIPHTIRLVHSLNPWIRMFQLSLKIPVAYWSNTFSHFLEIEKTIHVCHTLNSSLVCSNPQIFVTVDQCHACFLSLNIQTYYSIISCNIV